MKQGTYYIENLFKSNRLLAKSLATISIEGPDCGYNIAPWRKEIELLKAESGCCISSTTLLIQGEHVPTYCLASMGYGMLFDANKSNVFSVSPKDNNTSRADKMPTRDAHKGINLLSKNEIAEKKGLLTLDGLAEYTVNKKSTEMNEISTDVFIDGLVGLYVRGDGLNNNPQRCLESIAVQKYLKEAHGLDLPLMMLNEKSGILIELKSSKQVISPLAFALKQNALLQEHLQPLGYEFKNGLIDKPFEFPKYKAPQPGPQLGSVLKELAGIFEDNMGKPLDMSNLVKEITLIHENFDGKKPGVNEIKLLPIGGRLDPFVAEHTLQMALEKVHPEVKRKEDSVDWVDKAISRSKEKQITL
jgi:hypothetical protein